MGLQLSPAVGAAARLRQPPKWVVGKVGRLEEVRLRLGRHGGGREDATDGGAVRPKCQLAAR